MIAGFSWECLGLDGYDGRKIADDGRPIISAVGRPVYLAAGGAEVHAARFERVDRRRVAPDNLAAQVSFLFCDG